MTSAFTPHVRAMKRSEACTLCGWPPAVPFSISAGYATSGPICFSRSISGGLFWKLRAGELEMLDVCATPFLHLPLIRLIAWVKRIPLALTCHEALLASLPGYVQERGHRGGLKAAILLRILTYLYCSGMGPISRRIAVSKRTAAAMAREGFPAEAVIEFGLEPEVRRPQAPAANEAVPGSPVRLVSCGRLTPIKSVDQAVLALLALRAEGETFHLDIIGEGGQRSRLEQLVAEAQAKSFFTFHGEVSEGEKRRLLAESEIFILSSPREGFSIATLEAMAEGCAALVVSDPAQPNGALDFVHREEQGLCVAPGIGAMKEGLRRLLQDAELRLRLRRGAWAMAETYRIEAQTGVLLNFFAAAVRSGK